MSESKSGKTTEINFTDKPSNNSDNSISSEIKNILNSSTKTGNSNINHCIIPEKLENSYTDKLNQNKSTGAGQIFSNPFSFKRKYSQLEESNMTITKYSKNDFGEKIENVSNNNITSSVKSTENIKSDVNQINEDKTNKLVLNPFIREESNIQKTLFKYDNKDTNLINTKNPSNNSFNHPAFSNAAPLSNPFTNPFLNKQNPFISQTKNNFNSTSIFKPNTSDFNTDKTLNLFPFKGVYAPINFNMNEAKAIKNDSDNEDEIEVRYNPEEEQKIIPKIDTKFKLKSAVDSNTEKLLKMNVEYVSIYNAEEKKYMNKKEGELSIEKEKKEGKVDNFYCVLRNSTSITMNALIKNFTTLKIINVKDAYLHKVIIKIDKEFKPKIIRIKFKDNETSAKFEEIFNNIIKSLN